MSHDHGIEYTCPQCNVTMQGAGDGCSACGYGYIDEDDDRDDYTNLGQSMYCPRCDDYRICVRENAPPRNAFDPTETYTLECSHTVLGCEQPPKQDEIDLQFGGALGNYGS